MNSPRPFKIRNKAGYSVCMGCSKWTYSNNYFFAEGVHWILCEADFADYWFNTDELPSDYRDYGI